MPGRMRPSMMRKEQYANGCTSAGPDQRAVLAYVGAEYEVYAQFDALTDRSGALAMCQRLCTYIKNQHSDLFVPLSL